MTHSDLLIAEIERVATALGKSTSTISREVGQGGKFYDSLKAGARVWPETCEKVVARLNEMAPPDAAGKGAA